MHYKLVMFTFDCACCFSYLKKLYEIIEVQFPSPRHAPSDLSREHSDYSIHFKHVPSKSNSMKSGITCIKRKESPVAATQRFDTTSD